MSESIYLPKKGFHIAFTGIDGAGKSTQAGRLTHHIQTMYGRAYFAEPRTDLISQLLHTLAHQHGQTGRRAYYGNHVVDFSKAFDVVRDYYSTIAPLLSGGMHVIEPRTVYCRIAMALAMEGARDKKTEEVLATIPRPDLLFWIDTDPTVALARINKRGIDTDRLGNLQSFSQAFRQMPESESWIRLNGNLLPGKIFHQVKKHLTVLF